MTDLSEENLMEMFEHDCSIHKLDAVKETNGNKLRYRYLNIQNKYDGYKAGLISAVLIPDKPNPFWIVWNPKGKNPAYRHNTEDSAIKEAKRLSRETIDNKFYVMQAIGVAKKECESYTVLDNLPF